MLLAGLMLLLVICGYVQLYEATNEVGQLQDEIATLQEKNDRLQSTYDEKVDLNTVESEAAKLGMHKPNSCLLYTSGAGAGDCGPGGVRPGRRSIGAGAAAAGCRPTAGERRGAAAAAVRRLPG